MAHIYTLDGAHLPRGPFVDANGIRHPAAVLDLWSDEDLASIGVTRSPAPAVPLETVKEHLHVEIDAAAERQRARYITLGAGQALTYQAKAAEAARVLLDSYPEPADYPLLSAEVGVTGETLHQVAQIVAHLHAQWQVAGSAIERARLEAKAAIDAAEDEATARAIVPNWPGYGAPS